MEWCVKSADQVRVVRSWEIDPDDYDSDDDPGSHKVHTLCEARG